MKVVVVGCGKIGQTIVSSLLKEKHDLLCIDSDPAIINEITNSFDVMTICGNGISYDVLKEAGIEKTELFIAVTGSDEFNMLSCLAAKKLGAKQTVARIRNSEYNTSSLEFMKESLNLSMAINPEKFTAEALYNLLKLPSAIKVDTFTSRKFEIVELIVKKGSALIGMSLIDMRKKFSGKFLIGVIERRNEVFIPNGSMTVCEEDKICVVCANSDTHKVLIELGFLQKEAKDVIILGGSKSAHYLAEKLLKGRTNVKIIEKNRDRCEELCESLPSGVDVICGDGMSQDILLEEGISTTDALVALTGSDEQNILISFYAMNQSVPKVISKVNRNELSELSEKLGLDCIVSPKHIIADILVRYARALNATVGSKVESLYSLLDGEAEALEFIVMQDFEYTDIPLKRMQLKKDVLIAGIMRGNDAFIPGGEDCIKANDKVIIIAKGKSLYSLTEIIEGR
ncbi:MAG: Trk system potassium transporter TrkA [Clostridia bacterium]|nr:Trk system potassium transporter TrkA [Clostridia bacterium]